MLADNRAMVTLCGEELEIEASLGAMVVYSNALKGKVEAPYKGSMAEDMIELMRHVEGDPIAKTSGSGALDTETIYRLLDLCWAMAYAAGSITQSYSEWEERMSHANVSYFEMSALYDTLIHQLGDGATFRLPAGLRDDLASYESDTQQ